MFVSYIIADFISFAIPKIIKGITRSRYRTSSFFTDKRSLLFYGMITSKEKIKFI
ncbi:MAG: hypothetical protein ACKOQS_28345 [Dolichospermum sp.]